MDDIGVCCGNTVIERLFGSSAEFDIENRATH
jgi:hypothetical protein